jgi:hypothetical protein
MMFERLKRTLMRESVLDWMLVLFVAALVIPACLSVGMKQPIQGSLRFNLVANPILALGFVLIGQVIGFLRIAWQRGQWLDADVNPIMGTIFKTLVCIFQYDAKAAGLVTSGFVLVSIVLSMFSIPTVVYAAIMVLLVGLSMSTYRHAAHFANAQGLSSLSPAEKARLEKLIDQRRKDRLKKGNWE